MDRILITGANGLLGQKLVKLLAEDKNIELIASAVGSNRNPPGSYQFVPLDITSERQVNDVITSYMPDVIINTAAMTNVDQCELEPDPCWKLNVEAVKFLTNASKSVNAHFIHLSTDFVFDGTNGPYKESDKPNPLSKYAESKLESERVVTESGVSYAIIRTMLVYGIVPDMSRTNIILWVKKNLEEGKEIKVVNDQWRTPTLAEDLAQGCALVAANKAKGIYHVSGKDLLTPYDMAIATARFFGLDQSLIREVDGSIFTQPARRPAKTGFILDKAKKDLGYDPVSFEEGLKILKSQLQDV